MISQKRVTLFWPDSCWLLSNRPLYIPDFKPEFRALPAAAWKIGRLGKSVAPRFADRYLGAFTSALIILPADAWQGLQNEMLPAPADYCFDNSIVVGDWGDARKSRLSLRVQDEAGDITETELTLPSDEDTRAALSRMSARNTIKMGDLLLMPLAIPPVRLTENMHISILAHHEEDNAHLEGDTGHADDNNDSTILLSTRFK